MEEGFSRYKVIKVRGRSALHFDMNEARIVEFRPETGMRRQSCSVWHIDRPRRDIVDSRVAIVTLRETKLDPVSQISTIIDLHLICTTEGCNGAANQAA